MSMSLIVAIIAIATSIVNSGTLKQASTRT
jgi:hypothetical protein